MWNASENCDVKYGGERWCGIWWITLMWNMVGNGDVNVAGNGDVKYGGERWCGMWWRTFDVECGGER